MKNFKTKNGKIIPSVTTVQMREIDRIALEETGPNLYQMMENAGRNLAMLAVDLLGKNWHHFEIVVLAGTGGNGGGGICAARHLANRSANVKLCLTRSENLNEIVSWQRKIFLNAGGKEIEPRELTALKPDLIIDAIIGYSLRGVPVGAAKEFIDWANDSSAPILSLDVPSGIDATSGKNPGAAIEPKWTLTLALPKSGLSPENSGDIFLADIGIPTLMFEKLGLEYTSPFEKDFVIPLNVFWE
ncbi:MAG: NAD(P)H-hydrate epimerase [Calditrichaeota bacterium]|nr:NAD(P)H-hydrate epimerase [Calditrichota bacterium]